MSLVEPRRNISILVPTQAGAAVVFLLAAGVLLGWLVGCRGDSGENTRKAVPVQLARVEPETFRRTVSGVGTLRAADRVEIRPDAMGFVTRISFRRGSMVQAGNVLFVLDQRELTDKLAAARAQLRATLERQTNARRSFERVREAYRQGAANQEELDQALTNYEALQADADRLRADIRLLEVQLDDTVVRAPLTGRMSDHLVDVGDYVQRGALLARLYSNSAMEVRFLLGQEALGKVRRGQDVRIRIDAFPDRVFRGSVSYVGPALDVATRELPVVAVLDGAPGPLRPGAFVAAEVTIKTHRDAPSVPEEALVATSRGYHVFVVSHGVAHSRPVRVGLRRPGRVEIVHGLKMGEWVVRTGQMRLQDGATVRVVSRQRPKTNPTTQPERPAARPAPSSSTAPTRTPSGAQAATTRDRP